MNAALTVYIGKKITHFLNEFKEYAPVMEEYNEDTDSRDIIIPHPAAPGSDTDAITVEFGEEFNVYWHQSWYFSPEDTWYEMLLEQVHAILEGKIAVLTLTAQDGREILTVVRDTLPDAPLSPEDAAELLSPSAEEAERLTALGIPYLTREQLLTALPTSRLLGWKWNAPAYRQSF